MRRASSRVRRDEPASDEVSPAWVAVLLAASFGVQSAPSDEGACPCLLAVCVVVVVGGRVALLPIVAVLVVGVAGDLVEPLPGVVALAVGFAGCLTAVPLTFRRAPVAAGHGNLGRPICPKSAHATSHQVLSSTGVREFMGLCWSSGTASNDALPRRPAVPLLSAWPPVVTPESAHAVSHTSSASSAPCDMRAE